MTEKQVEKKPLFSKSAMTYYCPECGKFLFQEPKTGEYKPYCPDCGQKLDWSGVDDE